jgi:DNA-binding transcriptional LysR family regulator
MDKFDALQLFVRIVECRSFTGAATALDMPRATATHGINELEARLGIRLLERTTRQVRPTPDGQAFYERCLQVLADLEDAESSLQPAMSNPRGTLRLDMSGTHATRIVLPRIDEFRAKYPGIDLVISCSDRLVDLVRDGVDCVIRAGTPRDSSLVARRLAVMPQVLCAAPKYLGRFGVPSQPDDLAGHQSVGFFSRTQGANYPIELVVDGAPKSFALNSPVSVDDAENYVVCALRGCGLIQLPRFHVEAELGAGSLVALLEDWPSPGLAVSALYSYHRQLSPRVRVFIDWVRGIYEGRFGAIPRIA